MFRIFSKFVIYFVLLPILFLSVFSVNAMKPQDKEFIREGDRLIQKGSYGQKEYRLQQYQVKNGKICPIKNGEIEYRKPCLVIESRK
jgi:hypothetical protein